MHLRKTALVFLTLVAGLLAETPADPAAVERQQKDLAKRQSRELQKVDQAEEQERIKIRSRERDDVAAVQRDTAAAAGKVTVTALASGNIAGIDMTKIAQLKFAEDEVHNLIQNQLSPEVANRFNRDRNAINRKYTLEEAKLAAQQIDAGDDTAKQRDQATKTAEVTAKYQEQLDDLALEQEAESAKFRFAHTTKINAAERDLSILTTKHLLEQSAKGAAAVYNPAADPDYAQLAATRDTARSALETALDELRAKISVRRTDIENARDDEQAKIAGN